MSDVCRLIRRAGRTRPVAGRTASRNPSPSTSAQCTKTQIAEASGRRQHRSTAVCRALLFLPQSAGRAGNPQAEDGPALASHGFPRVLALEVAVGRRPAKDARRRSPARSRDERCQPPVGAPRIHDELLSSRRPEGLARRRRGSGIRRIIPSPNPLKSWRERRARIRSDRPDICLRNQWDVTLFERGNVP
jgi:hypothetical protein